MLEGLVENRAIACSTCGAGPFQGREETYKEGKELITECNWICSRCGSKFCSGIISRTPIASSEK